MSGPDSIYAGKFDYSLAENQNKICGGQGCNADSLNAQIKLWSKEPDVRRKRKKKAKTRDPPHFWPFVLHCTYR